MKNPKLYKVVGVKPPLNIILKGGEIVTPAGLVAKDKDSCRESAVAFLSGYLIGKSLVVYPAQLEGKDIASFELFATGVELPSDLSLSKNMGGLYVGFSDIDGGFFRGSVKVLALNVNAVLIAHGCVSYVHKSGDSLQHDDLYQVLSKRENRKKPGQI